MSWVRRWRKVQTIGSATPTQLHASTSDEQVLEVGRLIEIYFECLDKHCSDVSCFLEDCNMKHELVMWIEPNFGTCTENVSFHVNLCLQLNNLCFQELLICWSKLHVSLKKTNIDIKGLKSGAELIILNIKEAVTFVMGKSNSTK